MENSYAASPISSMHIDPRIIASRMPEHLDSRERWQDDVIHAIVMKSFVANGSI